MHSKLQIESSRRSPILGGLLYYLFPVRRRIIADNVHRVFGANTPRKTRVSLMKAFYRHMLQFMFEVAASPFTSIQRRKEQTTVENPHYLEEVLSHGKGALWLCCHLGNWEVSIVNMMEHLPHLKGQVSLIRKPLNPKLLNRFIVNRFESAGITVMAPEPSSLKKILQRLRRNESIIFVHDQHISIESATRTEFLGHTVQSARTLAKIALKTQVPVIPAITWRDGDGRHVCHFGRPIPTVAREDPDEAVRLTTRAYNKALEGYILRFPDQWFGWAHRLWKAADGPMRKKN